MAEPLLPNGLRAAIEDPLPPELPKPKGGRPRLPDRAALTGILLVLGTGTPWEYLPMEMGCGSGMTCWRRLLDRQRQGVWARLRHLVLDRLKAAGRIRWDRAAPDSDSVPAKRGGQETGPNPRDRGKPGTKRHIVTDAEDTSLGIALSSANRHDSKMLAPTLDVVPGLSGGRRGRPRRRLKKLHADKAYDSRPCRQACRKRGITPRIARKSIEDSKRLGRHR